MMLIRRSLATAAAAASLTALTLSLPARATEAPTAAPLADGVYLYGETAEPDTLGATYMTFEVRQGRLLGAFYQPHSSFDCFVGEPVANRLELTIADSYSDDTYPYSVALERSAQVASNQGLPTALSLEGLQPLAAAGDRDRDIIATCRAALGE